MSKFAIVPRRRRHEGAIPEQHQRLQLQRITQQPIGLAQRGRRLRQAVALGQSTGRDTLQQSSLSPSGETVMGPDDDIRPLPLLGQDLELLDEVARSLHPHGATGPRRELPPQSVQLRNVAATPDHQRALHHGLRPAVPSDSRSTDQTEPQQPSHPISSHHHSPMRTSAAHHQPITINSQFLRQRELQTLRYRTSGVAAIHGR